MTIVTVNVFNGTGSQIPRTYQVDANIYQDIITSLINFDIKSGQIYGLRGEMVNYNDNIKLTEVNYIIPEESTNFYNFVNVRGIGNRNFTGYYTNNTTFRDIYNQAIAYGNPLNSQIFVAGKIVQLEENVAPYKLNNVESIKIISPAKDTKSLMVRVPLYGEMEINVTLGVTRVTSILQQLNQSNTGFKLARVTRGMYNPYIYDEDEVLGELRPGEKLYLVPNYETLFAGYSASLGE